jgi:hypothetical protein
MATDHAIRWRRSELNWIACVLNFVMGVWSGTNSGFPALLCDPGSRVLGLSWRERNKGARQSKSRKGLLSDSTTLMRAGTPEDLIRLWLGHAARTVTDSYAGGLRNDLAWRREWCERIGPGFDLGYAGIQNVVSINAVEAA